MNSEKDPKINASQTDNADVGTAADVDAIMRKYDRESNTRVWEGVPKIIVGAITVLFSLFCLYVTLFANMDEKARKASFIGCIILIGFLTFPAKKGHVRVNHIPWYDIILMVVGVGCYMFYAFNAVMLNNLAKGVLKVPAYIVIGAVGILVLAELCRRSVGIPILCVAGAFVIYATIKTWNPRFGASNLIYNLFYGDSGVISTPVDVCSKYIVVFIIFGAFLERTGIADFFISLANSLCGRFAGGPAKVAVVSSALCGMVSGSSVGNTVTTGSVTIPMMKKTGYKAEFAGAVEASASTGGQIMPPIMGAAAFLMAEYVGVPYSNIIVRAILPAILYFLGIFIAVHLEAKKLGLKGISKDQLPRIKHLIKDTYLLLPLIVLVWLVSTNAKTMQFSAAIAIVMAIGVGFVNNLLRYLREKKSGAEMTNTSGNAICATFGIKGGFGVKNIFEALEAGGRGCISVGVACGIAGVIAGSLSITGLANKFNTLVQGVAGHSSLLALLLTMLCCIVLGMGVPTTANYCIMAATCAPILIEMGIPKIAAHFFVFYFGIVADITPFIFAYSPEILFIGDNILWYDIVLIVITATIGMIGVAAGLSGYLLKDMNIIERLLTIAGGLCLIIPGILTDAIGLGLIAVAVVMQCS